jgi:hypothetical protein
VSEIDLVALDVLPGQCNVEAEVDGVSERVRFQGVRPHPHRGGVQFSAWSGWFHLADCPIKLTWDAFEFPD